MLPASRAPRTVGTSRADDDDACTCACARVRVRRSVAFAARREPSAAHAATGHRCNDDNDDNDDAHARISDADGNSM